jgi:hypothetical protein
VAPERRDGGGAMGSMANAGERLTTSQPVASKVMGWSRRHARHADSSIAHQGIVRAGVVRPPGSRGLKARREITKWRR